MTVETDTIAIGAGDHVVQFYEQDAELAETVGSYLVEAARAGAVSIVIATQAHLRAFEAELQAADLDPAEAAREGTLVLLDAATTLESFMPGGRIDPDAFNLVIGGAIRRAGETGRPLRAYGEMVALLWDAGDVPAAIELETLWNELGSELQFSLLCAYRSESVRGTEHADALHQVCHLHASVLSEPDRHGTRSRDAIEVSSRFPSEVGAPRGARRFVLETLEQWNYDEELSDDAQLVVSELATNAVMHARTPFFVVVRKTDAGVRISVRDSSRVQPGVSRGDLLAASGRGLRLVALLSSSWGVDATAGGKSVWAQLGRG